MSSMVKGPLGSAPARLLCLLRARLAALGNSALLERGRRIGRPATASAALAESRRFHCVWSCRFSKSLATPDPIPEEGQKRALELMKSGALFRYTPGVESETALAEWDMTERTGFKYSVGFNSCGSALFIALKTCGVQPGDHVLANGFSFTAVPSAIHHAGGIPVYVESTEAYVMDMEDLERKIKESAAAGTKIKWLMLTHMRGKVAEMQKVYEIAQEHGITVIEDCAHALGVMWDGVQLGRSASVACYSSQSAKVINSGEGGFFMTDDDELAAKAACYAGCYEQLYLQHVVAPPAEVCDRSNPTSPSPSPSPSPPPDPTPPPNTSPPPTPTLFHPGLRPGQVRHAQLLAAHERPRRRLRPSADPLPGRAHRPVQQPLRDDLRRPQGLPLHRHPRDQPARDARLRLAAVQPAKHEPCPGRCPTPTPTQPQP